MEAPKGVLLASRSYNDQGAAGTFGQYLPGVPSCAVLGVGDQGVLMHAKAKGTVAQPPTPGTGFRTNLGLTEWTGVATTVEATVYSDTGVMQTRQTLTVPAFGWWQGALDAAPFGVTNLEDGYVTLKVTGGGMVAGYLSVADNRTSDAVCVPLQFQPDSCRVPCGGLWLRAVDADPCTLTGVKLEWGRPGDWNPARESGTCTLTRDGTALSVNPNQLTTFTDPGATPNTVVTYRLACTNDCNPMETATVYAPAKDAVAGTPVVPTLVSPAHGAVEQPVAGTLDWSDDPNASSWDVYLGTTADPGKVGSSTISQYAYTALSQGAQHYWKVVAKNACGAASASPIHKFFTQGGIVLSFIAFSVNDTATGDGDGNLDPGETALLSVTLKNESTTAVTSAKATLTTTSTGISITSTATFTIPPQGTATGTFTISISSTYMDSAAKFSISVAGTIISSPNFTVPVGTAAANTQVIPILAHAAGVNNTNWKTDLVIHNASHQSMDFTMKLIKCQVYNDTPPQASFTFGPGGTYAFDDLLDNPELPVFQGYTLGSLLLDFTGDIEPAVMARLYNDLGTAGTYGISIPAIRANSQDRGTCGNIPATLFGLRKTDRYRTNLGVVNISGDWNSMEIALRDSSGMILGNYLSWTLAPYNMIQINDILASAEIPTNVDAFTATVHSQSGNDFVAYATLVDNVTGDAIYISDQIDPHAQNLVPGVAHTAGSGNSIWKSDLSIYNPDPSPVAVRITYYRYGYEGGGAMIRRGPIPAYGSLILDDILGLFAGLSESEAGFLIVEPENAVTTPPLVFARTYNDLGTSGTYGQCMDGLSLEEGGHSGQLLIITGLTSNVNYRTNVGLINANADGEALASMRLYDSYGMVLGAHDFYLPYNMMGLQISNDELLSMLGIVGPFENATLVVTVGGDDLFAYAILVDNITNDPLYLPATVR